MDYMQNIENGQKTSAMKSDRIWLIMIFLKIMKSVIVSRWWLPFPRAGILLRQSLCFTKAFGQTESLRHEKQRY